MMHEIKPSDRLSRMGYVVGASVRSPNRVDRTNGTILAFMSSLLFSVRWESGEVSLEHAGTCRVSE